MNKKIIILIVLILGLTAAFLIWKYYFKKLEAKSDSPIINQNRTIPTKEPVYPKVEDYNVPILMYHYIRDYNDPNDQIGINLSVAPQNFEEHLEWLKDNDYETLKLADLADPDRKTLSKIAYDKKKPIVITFDDGYEDAYSDAYPALKKNGFIGTFYIIRDYVGRAEYMNQTQIDELQKAGMEIGSHSLSHPDLSKADGDAAHSQIFDSKQDSQTFCYPSGKYNDTVVSLVKEAGYTTAVTTKFGIANQDSNLLELPRVRVENGSGESLGNKISAALEQK